VTNIFCFIFGGSGIQILARRSDFQFKRVSSFRIMPTQFLNTAFLTPVYQFTKSIN
jgi:hypothetical protein